MSQQPDLVLGDHFVAALGEAVRLHAHQARKGTGVPYLSHLLSVAGLVLEYGGDEDQAIAALLHDGPEDQGGEDTLAAIREQFGGRVADIVAACSDTFATPKPPWRARKEAYLDHLDAMPAPLARDVLPVTLADKVHNARSIVADLREYGLETLDRFNGGREGTLWYYGALSERLSVLAPGPLAHELARLVAEMRAPAGR